ncbi:hypothetical protein OAH87_06040 [Marinomonas sp.]|nr:hypothetical protein [Marinomonas sp.]MDB4838011.1 hypothetical protein [Marinomonas sp.]
MMNYKRNIAIVLSVVISPLTFAESVSSLTIGMGNTDYSLSVPSNNDPEFTSTSWQDLNLSYVSRSISSGVFFSVDYRISQSADHTTFYNTYDSDADDYGEKTASDLDDTRLSISFGNGPIYVGYLQYSTDIMAPEEQTSGFGSVTYDLKGFTAGLNFSSSLGSKGHVLQYGFGGLMAIADLTQVNLTDDDDHYIVEYDSSFGYFYGVGVAGPIGTSGFAYSIKYEVQKINFDAIYDDGAVELDDERSRLSASLTYVFL